MTEDSDIQIDGFGHNPTDDEIRSLVGAVVHILVGGSIPPEGVSWFELFRFARVQSVTRRSRWRFRRCPVCETKRPRFELELEWEAGYESPHGNILCEHCVDGVVRTGHDHIAFGDSQSRSDGTSISTTYDLTK